MKITAHFHGILADWVGTGSASMELPSHATYGHLMDQIGRRYRMNMPQQLWDMEKKAFSKKVRAFVLGRPLNELDEPLPDGAEITFMLMMAGG